MRVHQDRVLQRVKFLKNNKRLSGKAFAPQLLDRTRHLYHEHKDWKLPAGRALVNKARSDIGYSCCTASCDIFWSLKGLYDWLIDNKVI